MDCAPSSPSWQAVLFDLDGTLVDSAPDLAGAANDLRAEHGLEALAYEVLRPLVGSGARGMVGAAFGARPGDEGYEALRTRFLDLYGGRLLRHTQVFDEVWLLIDTLERAGLRWGIVTNKAEHLALQVAGGLGLHPRAGALVGGDTTPHAKPHPAPLIEGARRLGVEPARCLYVGDDLRDIQAGRAAGMAPLAAAWGYLGAGEPVHAWGADAVLESPAGLLQWLRLP
jgi:2-phosphoglycolate phosphatase